MKITPITENHLFRKAYDKGRSCPGRYVAVYVLKDFANRKFRNADPCHRPLNRVGLTVGKKLGGAVVRVRARRLMREAYRLIEAEENRPLSHGWLIVLAARGRIAEAKMPEVRADMERSFEKLGLIRPVSGADNAGKADR